jgi:prepilin-type N-terminal cleavage/methylation domain-containing protein
LRHPGRLSGFTVLELLLVVALMGIAATLAIPALHRARTASIEASTIASLRTLVSAQASYAATCASGFFAPTVAALSSGTGSSAFVGPEFRTDTTDRFGYRIRFTAGPVARNAPRTCNGIAAGRTRQSYFIAADPLYVGSGQGVRHFGTGQGITIFASSRRISAYYNGDPPSPARPIS